MMIIPDIFSPQLTHQIGALKDVGLKNNDTLIKLIDHVFEPTKHFLYPSPNAEITDSSQISPEEQEEILKRKVRLVVRAFGCLNDSVVNLSAATPQIIQPYFRLHSSKHELHVLWEFNGNLYPI